MRAQESNHAYPDRWFQYDGVRPVLEGTLSGNTFTTVNRYVLEGESYYDPLAFAQIGGAWRYYLYDGLGSTRQLLDGSQTVTDTYTYEAFGNLMGSTGTTANPYRYVGSLGYYQTGSSLQHLGARYYLPEVGRFVTSDPSGDEDNLYAYVSNLPTSGVDPTGLLNIRLPRLPKIPKKPKVYYPPQDLEVDPMAWHLCMTCCMTTTPVGRIPVIGNWWCTRWCRSQFDVKVPGAPKPYQHCWDRERYPDTESCQECCDDACSTSRGGIALDRCYAGCP